MTVKVGLVQINNSFSGQNYFPYSVGLLQAYAEKNLKNKDDFSFLLPIYSRIKVDEAVEHLKDADIILFSTYVWNFRLSLKIAGVIKSQRAEVTVVFGGPHVPDDAEKLLRENPCIDIAAHKEGERIVPALLEKFQCESWDDIPSISYLNKDGKYIQNKWVERIKDLEEIPSPYLEGTFDALMKANPDERWLVMWETNRGCPFSCTFCDWGSATQAKVNKFGIERLFREIDWVREHKIEFIFCCDANFGILSRDYDIAKYAAESKDKYNYPQALSVQNTKNAREKAYIVQKFLSDSGLNKGVTLSLQSTDPTTLENVKRDNISLDTYKDLQHRFTKDKIETYSDMILGMPGETYDSFVNGISEVIENGQHNRIQFGNLTILPNAEMGDIEYQNKFGMESIETEIINIHGSLLSNEEIFETQDMVVSTNSMPRKDWVKTRAICWMTAFIYFDKVLQIPFIVLNKVGGLTFRELLEIFVSDKVQEFPVISSIKAFFVAEAEKIQNGGAEYCESKKWLNIWWPADELELIHLCTENRLADFYNEAEQLLNKLLAEKFIDLPENLLHDAMMLNKNLIKIPLQEEDATQTVSFNIWELYQNHLIGIDVPILEQTCTHTIDRTTQKWSSWEQWCQEVIWYGNKKGAYLYTISATENTDVGLQPRITINQIAGHH